MHAKHVGVVQESLDEVGWTVGKIIAQPSKGMRVIPNRIGLKRVDRNLSGPKSIDQGRLFAAGERSDRYDPDLIPARCHRKRHFGEAFLSAAHEELGNDKNDLHQVVRSPRRRAAAFPNRRLTRKPFPARIVAAKSSVEDQCKAIGARWFT